MLGTRIVGNLLGIILRIVGMYVIIRYEWIGKSYVIHPKNLSVKNNVVYLPSYMTFCL